ncbi:MAG TPA: thrombospondin type 3 repeat-containing protein, partial [Solirubrobacter sp.]|nr:thrombospondin type 3 repeat-containing protein [Solirubrobacter sp.]
PDGDQVSEIADNCKGLANGVQSDADGDRVGDACDDDDDGDGVLDATDPCPLVVGGSCAGDMDGDTVADATDNCPLVANAEQIDSDANGIGDACGPTFGAGTVGGAVPATLALTLGTAATFGAFTPGVDRDYDATTTANVISTGGDAALSVSDAGTNATGRLVNGAFSLSEPLQAKVSGAFAPLSTAGTPLPLLSYAAPVSNDAVPIAFRQHIGPTEALRTGTYGKTLTVTLSSTTP